MNKSNPWEIVKDTMDTNCPCFSVTPIGRKRHAPHEQLVRHVHREAFASILLSGGYVEAGDRGRLRASAGDVVLHGPYESHLDHVAPSGAEVLVLPCEAHVQADIARIADPDLAAKLAERDPAEAAHYVAAHLIAAPQTDCDWPDRLARDLRADPDLSLHAWASAAGLAPESISRGFRRVFGVAPASFRQRVRALRAVAVIGCDSGLAQVASACGFADQAHMSRNIRRLTGHSPKTLREKTVA